MNAYVGLFPGFAYIEYENPEDAKAALRHMDGGQIDGQEVTETQHSVTVHCMQCANLSRAQVTAAPVLMPKFQPRPARRSPPRGGRGGRSRSVHHNNLKILSTTAVNEPLRSFTVPC